MSSLHPAVQPLGIRYLEHTEEGYAELRVNGGVSHRELDDFKRRFGRFSETHPGASMLEVVERFGPSEGGTWLPAMRFRLTNVRRMNRLAVVTDSLGLCVLLALVDRVVPTTIRTFARPDEDRARAWVRGASGHR